MGLLEFMGNHPMLTVILVALVADYAYCSVCCICNAIRRR